MRIAGFASAPVRWVSGRREAAVAFHAVSGPDKRQCQRRRASWPTRHYGRNTVLMRARIGSPPRLATDGMGARAACMKRDAEARQFDYIPAIISSIEGAHRQCGTHRRKQDVNASHDKKGLLHR